MTELLEKAFLEASKLPEQEQDAFAVWLLEERASEQRWEEVFANSADVLAHMADEALTEHRQGRTQMLDPDRL
ncbi:MAG: hypothetical protein HY709_09395 [Candidatus Latescibacteria bacterium]|nr:hypothetical protein [Candidatus Latescibacterota bacterium]